MHGFGNYIRFMVKVYIINTLYALRPLVVLYANTASFYNVSIELYTQHPSKGSACIIRLCAIVVYEYPTKPTIAEDGSS